MKSSKFHVMASLALSAALFHVGCGDDDENVSPGTGGSSANGGKTGSGGGNNAGTDPGAGGKSGTGGQATTGGNGSSGGRSAAGGSGSSEGGAGGVPITPEGGSGGSGGSPEALPACDGASYDSTAECYANCSPKTSASSEQFLNHCSEAGVQCTKFTAALPKLGANGALPPLP